MTLSAEGGFRRGIGSPIPLPKIFDARLPISCATSPEFQVARLQRRFMSLSPRRGSRVSLQSLRHTAGIQQAVEKPQCQRLWDEGPYRFLTRSDISFPVPIFPHISWTDCCRPILSTDQSELEDKCRATIPTKWLSM